jgi:hypothetical protein
MYRKGDQFREFMQRKFDALFGFNESGSGDINGFMDLARDCLEASGVERPERSHDQLLARAMTSDDFPAILSNTTNQLLQESFRRQPATYAYWSEVWQVPDFKKADIARVGYPGDMPEVKELGEYERLEVEEGVESASLATYGGMLGFSRQMLINDSLGAFRERTRAGGVIARQTVSRRCYKKLLSPGNLSDGNPFFDASRGNLLEGTSGDTLELSADSLGRAIAALREQQDDSGNHLNLEPKYLVVPPALEITAWSLCLGNSLLGQANSGVPNPFKDRYGILPVIAPELADSSLGGNDKDWFVFADPKVVPASFKVLTLTGDWPEPKVEQRPIFERDEVQMKIRTDFQPAAINPKGCVKVSTYKS